MKKGLKEEENPTFTSYLLPCTEINHKIFKCRLKVHLQSAESQGNLRQLDPSWPKNHIGYAHTERQVKVKVP